MAKQTRGNNSTRRNFLTGSAAGLAASCLTPAAGAADSKPPNIVFLMTDNQRWNMLGCMGNDIIQTPNIDRLSERGVRFDNTFCTTAICAASRASIFTPELCTAAWT